VRYDLLKWIEKKVNEHLVKKKASAHTLGLLIVTRKIIMLIIHEKEKLYYE
jgi:hypothetical protein